MSLTELLEKLDGLAETFAVPLHVDFDQREDGSNQIVDSLGMTTAFMSTGRGNEVGEDPEAEFFVLAVNAYPLLRKIAAAYEAWRQYDDADPQVKGECLREARERGAAVDAELEKLRSSK